MHRAFTFARPLFALSHPQPIFKACAPPSPFSSSYMMAHFSTSSPKSSSPSPSPSPSPPPSTIGNDIKLAHSSLLTADCVCFDVDSTVIMEEGIDVLAAYLNKGDEVTAITTKAMQGHVKFQDALAARLELIKPSKQSIEDCLEIHPFEFSPKIPELISILQKRGVPIFFVSGGFRIMIEPIAASLNVPPSNIIANTIFFDPATSEYAGFDATELTSADLGKPKAVQYLMDTHGFKTVVMVGDGATDAQAKPPASAFIGYGGVADREVVREKADWFVYNLGDVVDLLSKEEEEDVVE